MPCIAILKVTLKENANFNYSLNLFNEHTIVIYIYNNDFILQKSIGISHY